MVTAHAYAYESIAELGHYYASLWSVVGVIHVLAGFALFLVDMRRYETASIQTSSLLSNK